jgi:DNA-binding beta-propeller fold protein YncE
MAVTASLATAECTTSFLRTFGGEPNGRLAAPNDVAIDSKGNAWVADTGHNRVQEFNSSGEYVTQFDVAEAPQAIDLDAEGDVWVLAETKVREYSPKGELKLSFGSHGTENGQFQRARGIALDPSGNVWVVDAGVGSLANRVQKFNAKGEYLSKFGKEGTGNGEFKSPEAIAVDSEGKVWVTDSGNGRIERFSAKGAYLSQFGSTGSVEGRFSTPRGIAVSGSNIWVADTGNGRVQELSCL